METNAEQTAGTVLIVDDNMINRAVLENIFAPQYTVIEAENGKEALDMLMEHREEICAVILDVIMPVMDGIEALEKMNILGITGISYYFGDCRRYAQEGIWSWSNGRCGETCCAVCCSAPYRFRDRIIQCKETFECEGYRAAE